ncbi:MAG: Shedu anti-phage system protein SduA domain-containing protein, partial [Phycisphaerae bacterium]
YPLERGLPSALESFDPRCVVIIGNTKEIQGDEDKVRCLELFRSHTSGVAIITFDELFEKTRRLIQVLEAPEGQ